MEKVLIEEASTELLELFDLVSEEARKEKNAVPPINEMLYWWTRKPLIVGRAIILASTLDSIRAVKDLLSLKREKRAYTYIPDIGTYKQYLGRDPSQIKILDPFGGAGNLIFEPKRLGLDCMISDYNPVAYLLEKAVLEYPSKYGTRLVEDFKKYAVLVIEKTKEVMKQFYENNDLAYLWVWCIKCLHCGQRFPLVNHMWIAKTNKNKIGFRFIITQDKNFRIELIHDMKADEVREFTQKGGTAICINCRNGISYESITEDISKRKDREMIAKLVIRSKKRIYVLATDDDKKLFGNASNYLKTKWNEFENENLVPDEKILASHRRENMLWHYGIEYWRDFFSARQLLLMITIMKSIKSITDKIESAEEAKIIALYLSLLLCKHVNSNALGVVWNIGGEKPEHALALRRPAFVYNHVEINPFQKIRGSLPNMIENIYDSISFAKSDKHRCKVLLESALKLSEAKKLRFNYYRSAIS